MGQNESLLLYRDNGIADGTSGKGVNSLLASLAASTCESARISSPLRLEQA